jgi:hypothetical protein
MYLDLFTLIEGSFKQYREMRTEILNDVIDVLNFELGKDFVINGHIYHSKDRKRKIITAGINVIDWKKIKDRMHK